MTPQRKPIPDLQQSAACGESMAFFYLFGIGVGLLMIAVAVFNWESWFLDHESRFIEMIGWESWVRWYWGLSGVGLIGVSLFYWLQAH